MPKPGAKHYVLHVVHDAPSNFHNQQFGRHHGFQVEIELRDRDTGAIVDSEDLAVGWELFYANTNGELPPEDRVENQDILMFLQRSTPHIKNGAATFKLRLKEVSKNHMKRKFQIKLFAEPSDLPSGVIVDPVYLNPIFVLSKVPRKYRSMYTESAICRAMEVDGDDEASMLARRQMGMQSRGKPLDRVTAASVLAATQALGSDAPTIKHDLVAIAKQVNANAPKSKSGATPRKRTHAMMTESGAIDPAIVQWCFLVERQIRQLEWMEVPGTMHVACPVCKASYLSAAPFMKRRHLEGCTMGQCVQAMPNSLQIELRRMQHFPHARVVGNYQAAQGSHYPYQQGGDAKRARPQMASPTSSANVSNLPSVDANFAGNFGQGIAGTAGMLQRNASFRLQNLQTLATMSNGGKGNGAAGSRAPIPSLGSFAPSNLTNAASTMAGQSMTQEQIISWMEDAMVKPQGGASTSSASTSAASSGTSSAGPAPASGSAPSTLPRLQSIGDLMRHQSMSDILGKRGSISNFAKALNGGSAVGANSGSSSGATNANVKNNLSIPGVTLVKEEDDVKV